MRKLPKRLLATGLTLSMLGSLLVVPTSAATYEGADVYDHVLDIYEEDFKETVKFTPEGTADFTGDEWYDQADVIGINRERSKSQFISYQDTATALAAEKSVLDDVGAESSDFYQLLSGKDWDFAIAKDPAAAAELDAEYLAAEYTGDAFQPEYVPQAWQTYRNEDGTFKYDEPMYTNQIFPWAQWENIDYWNPHAPTVYNPVGYYRTTFTTPEDWDGREIFISLQSVESAYYLYINGKPVGYSTDSFTAHDFNITDYLNPAGEENTLALKVFRWSIGSWVENQDFIRQSGIYRDVYLYSKDEVEIRDFFFKTEFEDRADEHSDVAVTIETDIRGLHNAAEGEYTLSAYLMEDGNGTPVARAEDRTVTIAASAGKTAEEVLLDKGTTVISTMTVTDPDKWFPDTPDLYSLVLELKDSGGQVMESVVERVGFGEVYKVDIDDAGHEQMQINGRQMILRGVNRHDTDPETGHALNYEDYYADLTLMKQYNLNAVRTSHYPNDQVLYDLADELGLYVCAEANIESHAAASNGIKVPSGTGQGLPEWVPTVLDRVATNLERYKNHASIVMWSLGNEATYSQNALNDDYSFWVASMYLLKRDPSRLRKYERESDGYYGHYYTKAEGADPWSVDTRKNNIVDVHSTQYWLPSNVAAYNGLMPHIHSEYNHSMGQAYGNAKEHWEVIREKDNANGGFIWEFIDHTIRTVRIDEDGNREEFWGYGGDWIDPDRNDDAFCGDGMVFADRTPSPKMDEAKKVHQQVNFYADDLNVAPGGTIDIRVVNEYENTDLSAFDIEWTLTEDSLTQLANGTLELSTPHMYGQSLDRENVETVTLDIPDDFQPKEGSDYLLTFTVKSTEDKPWAGAGYEIAHEQFELSFEEEAPLTLEEPSVPFEDIQTIGDEMILTGTTDYGQAFKITLNTEEGTIVSYELDGDVVMTAGPEQSYYRAQTYNDTTVSWIAELKDAGAYENMSNVSVSVTESEDGTKVLMAMSGNLAVDASGLMGYNIYGNGEIVVLDQFIPASNFAPSGLPKVGSRMEIAEEYDNLTYYGRGPQETYVDRNSGAMVGVYTEKVYDYQDPMGEDSNWVAKKMIRPQENGNHTGVRWTSLTNDEGTGLLVSAQGEIEMSALHYTAEEMNSGSYNSPSNRHIIDVPHRPEIVWSIDLHQHGTSDTAFMGHRPLDGYRFATDQSYSYAYRISPIKTDDAAELMEKSNESFSVPSSSYPITGISINGNAVSNFDVNSTDGASYSMTADESVTEESVTVEGTTDFDVSFNEDGTITVSAQNNYGQTFAYDIALAREGTELPYTVFSGAKVENYYPGQGANAMIDNNTGTIWHSNWADGSTQTLSRLWFMVELAEPTAINGIRYYPRQDSSNINGAFGDHTVYVSDKPISELTGDPSSEDWTLVATGSWPKTTDWKATAFSQVATAKSILVYPGSTYGDTDNAFGSGAEFRVTQATEVDTSTLTVELEDNYTYVGEDVRPDPVVTTADGMRLIRGVDYGVTYANNSAPGTGTMTITLQGAFTGEPITREFQIVEGEKVVLTVVDGTVENATAGPDGTYQVYAGGKVTVVADEPAEDKMFDRWSSGDASIVFDNAESETATFTMPGADATVTANYVEAYLVTVVGGTLDEAGEISSMKVKAGSSIVVYAQVPEGKVFDHWETDGDDAQLTDAARNPALMNATPARDIVITAVFKTDETYFKLLTELPEFFYLDQPINLPGSVQAIVGDQQVDLDVTWSQSDLTALEEGGVGFYTLRGTVEGGHAIECTVALVPAGVVYFVDNGAEVFTDVGQAILDGNSETVRNTTTDQAYAEGEWGYTNPESEVESHADYGTDVYSTIRNMTDSRGEDPNDGRGKPLTYRFDGLEPGSYKVYIGYKNIWYQEEIQRVADIELFNSEGAAAEKQQTNLNVREGEYIVFEDVTVTAGDAAIPEEPVEETEVPMEDIEVPVEEPEAPVEEPEAPVEEPEAPVEEPEAPVEEPEAPVEEPEAPVEEPEAPVEEPEAPVEEPEAPVEDVLPETTLPSAELVGMSPLAVFLANESGETGGLILRMSPTAFENANNDMLVSFILITKAEAPETITVTYADGEETLSTQTILSGSTAVRPSDPVKDGFDFVGWYADEALETPYDFTQVLTEDTTIYAKWTESTEPEPETYTVTFDSMGGTAVDAQTVEEGGKATKPA
ncbi:glycoside hydrolase family 2 TIM barrel-domain containing protein, partial [uncultured Intestinimonas sp.]|uniref:glycoside hydrolase family 2 TIM barrel-domain containing protein n=1 Tax=uncultured Intestinimonas sp. TaxID=1689265 RepID=UPI0026173C5A